LLQDATLVRSIPLLKTKTVYTRIGDLFAQVCFAAALIVVLLEISKFALKFRK
jgi:apolipoprotein N-acyltransferase